MFMAIQRVIRLFLLLGINFDHGVGGVDRRDMRLLWPVTKLELRL